MDIEHLSKSQIILLTLLISFVTSMATGIVTVSLMEQAPPVVAQTVNRVIERTVETVTPETKGSQAAAATVVTQEKTVVVKETDLISQAVQKVEPSVVRIYSSGGETSSFIGIGLVLDANGTVVTDSAAMDERADATVVLSDGTRVRGFVVRRDKDNGYAVLQAATTTTAADGKVRAVQWVPARLTMGQPVLGATLIVIAGKTVSRIEPGVVTAILPVGGGFIVDTNIVRDSIYGGSPVVNTQGEVVGVSTGVSRTSSPQGFIPAAVLVPPVPAAQ